MTFAQRFLDLLERSVIVQSALPFVFGIPCVMMAMRGQEVPTWMLNLTWATVTFWMGSKATHASMQRRQDQRGN